MRFCQTAQSLTSQFGRRFPALIRLNLKFRALFSAALPDDAGSQQTVLQWTIPISSSCSDLHGVPAESSLRQFG